MSELLEGGEEGGGASGTSPSGEVRRGKIGPGRSFQFTDLDITVGTHMPLYAPADRNIIELESSDELESASAHVRADATSGNITITLPNASAFIGRQIEVTKVDSSANTVSFTAQSSEYLRKPSTFTSLTKQWETVILIATQTSTDDFEWLVLPTSKPTESVDLVLCAGYTPGSTGADTLELVVPYSKADGTSSITFNVRRLYFRVVTAGGAPEVRFEKYTGTGVFSATTIGSVTLGSGAYEGATTSSFTTSTLTSGDKIRLNFITLGTAQNWTCGIELGE